MNFDELETLAKDHPGEYILHVKSYAGFDPKYISPAAVLVNTESGEISLLDPLPSDFPKRCESLGVKIIDQ
jgi:hypothetical protein